MGERVTIPGRFNGPPGSANGGYACGLVAEATGAGDGAVRVTLRRPPPMDAPLDRERAPDGSVTLRHGDVVIATGKPARLDLASPPAPSFAAAAEAERHSTGYTVHPFPTCFVCGPRRGPDGLHLLPGPVGDGVVAATWTPAADLAGDGGAVEPRVVWAALDCPGSFACTFSGPAVLGALTARLVDPVRPGTPYVITGWPIASEGRRHRAGTALHAPDGSIAAFAESLWVELRDPATFAAAVRAP